MKLFSVSDNLAALMTKHNSGKLKLVIAFTTLYLVWGSTYLAIRIALETLPPFLMAGLRYVIASASLALFVPKKGWEKVTATHWKSAFIVGGFLFLGGNGGVVWSEQYVPSGITALIVATVPIWTVILEWRWMRKKRPDTLTLSGIILGFLGLWFLVSPSLTHHAPIPLIGIVVLLCASLSWAIGSIMTRRVKLPSSWVLASAMEMAAGGVWLFFLSFVSHDWQKIHSSIISFRSVAAVIYLVIFGALIGFTAYKYVLKNTSPTLSATYAYVNPVIAIFLGSAFAGEPLTMRVIFGAFIILAGVFLITISKFSKAATSENIQA